MEIYNPYEEEKSEQSISSAICEIPGGKKFSFGLCMKLSIRLLWKRILSSTMTTLLILLAFDIFFWVFQEELTTLYMALDVSISVFLVILNFFISWILSAKAMQRTTGAGNTGLTRVFDDRLEIVSAIQINNPYNMTNTSSSRPFEIRYQDLISLKCTKSAYIFTAKVKDSMNLFVFIILNDERLNDAARNIFKEVKDRLSNQEN